MDALISADACRHQNEEEIPSPALIFYTYIIEENIQSAIAMAGGADRLWPHRKTHKCGKLSKCKAYM